MRALLASMVFFERFLAPKNSNFGVENDVFCECILASLGICWALVFGRFSRRLSSEIKSFRALREKGADGFRPKKQMDFHDFSMFARPPGAQQGRQQGTKQTIKLPPPNQTNKQKCALFFNISAVSTPVAKRRAKMSPGGSQNGAQSGPRDPLGG